MKVFWARGYDGATPTDLQEAMGGITAPLAASWLPARRAAKLDPILALRRD